MRKPTILAKLSKRELLFIAKILEAVLGGTAIAVLVYATAQIAPAYIKNYEFEGAIRKEIQLAATNPHTAAAITDDVDEKAQDLGLAIEREGIKVTTSQKPVPIPVAGVEAIVASGSPNELPLIGDVSIDVSYAVPVPFPGHTFRWNFHFHADNHSG
jgi:hypothetical protein